MKYLSTTLLSLFIMLTFALTCSTQNSGSGNNNTNCNDPQIILDVRSAKITCRSGKPCGLATIKNPTTQKTGRKDVQNKFIVFEQTFTNLDCSQYSQSCELADCSRVCPSGCNGECFTKNNQNECLECDDPINGKGGGGIGDIHNIHVDEGDPINDDPDIFLPIDLIILVGRNTGPIVQEQMNVSLHDINYDQLATHYRRNFPNKITHAGKNSFSVINHYGYRNTLFRSKNNQALRVGYFNPGRFAEKITLKNYQ